jgi:hypothetical protein
MKIPSTNTLPISFFRIGVTLMVILAIRFHLVYILLECCSVGLVYFNLFFAFCLFIFHFIIL